MRTLMVPPQNCHIFTFSFLGTEKVSVFAGTTTFYIAADSIRKAQVKDKERDNCNYDFMYTVLYDPGIKPRANVVLDDVVT